MANINANQLAFYAVQCLTVPAEGPRAIPLALDFSSAGTYSLNLQNFEARNFISQIQSMYLDNSANTASLTVSFPGTNQQITIAPNRQGYFMVACPNPASITFSSAGGVLVNVQLYNFPQTNNDWPCITGA